MSFILDSFKTEQDARAFIKRVTELHRRSTANCSWTRSRRTAMTCSRRCKSRPSYTSTASRTAKTFALSDELEVLVEDFGGVYARARDERARHTDRGGGGLANEGRPQTPGANRRENWSKGLVMPARAFDGLPRNSPTCWARSARPAEPGTRPTRPEPRSAAYVYGASHSAARRWTPTGATSARVDLVCGRAA